MQFTNGQATATYTAGATGWQRQRHGRQRDGVGVYHDPEYNRCKPDRLGQLVRRPPGPWLLAGSQSGRGGGGGRGDRGPSEPKGMNMTADTDVSATPPSTPSIHACEAIHGNLHKDTTVYTVVATMRRRSILPGVVSIRGWRDAGSPGARRLPGATSRRRAPTSPLSLRKKMARSAPSRTRSPGQAGTRHWHAPSEPWSNRNSSASGNLRVASSRSFVPCPGSVSALPLQTPPRL